ncbi:MAG TPA: hypothetical protein VFN48_09625 [Solirubrobacteraceae bacterium]|nr:hypothetical protein [Solirubrobacteraceae bacterium]
MRAPLRVLGADRDPAGIVETLRGSAFPPPVLSPQRPRARRRRRVDGPAIEDRIDAWIEAQGIVAPVEARYTPMWAPADDGSAPLDLAATDVTTVIWAAGFSSDWSFVNAQAFDGRGYPGNRRGLTAVPGPGVLGLRGCTRGVGPRRRNCPGRRVSRRADPRAGGRGASEARRRWSPRSPVHPVTGDMEVPRLGPEGHTV